MRRIPAQGEQFIITNNKSRARCGGSGPASLNLRGQGRRLSKAKVQSGLCGEFEASVGCKVRLQKHTHTYARVHTCAHPCVCTQCTHTHMHVHVCMRAHTLEFHYSGAHTVPLTIQTRLPVVHCHWQSWGSSLYLSGGTSVFSLFVQSIFKSQTQDIVLSAEAETIALSALERSCACQKGTCAVLLTEFGGLGT